MVNRLVTARERPLMMKCPTSPSSISFGLFWLEMSRMHLYRTICEKAARTGSPIQVVLIRPCLDPRASVYVKTER